MLKTDAYTMLALSAHVIKIGEILFAIFNFSEENVSFNGYSVFFNFHLKAPNRRNKIFRWVSEINSAWYLAPQLYRKKFIQKKCNIT